MAYCRTSRKNIFNATDKIYQLNNGTINVFQKGKVNFIGKANQRLFLANEERLFEFTGNDFKEIPDSKILADKVVQDILEGESEELIIVTRNGGLFELKNEKIQISKQIETVFFDKNKIYCAATINSNGIALGVIANGLILMDKNGQFKYHLNNKNGLQNNTVLSVFQDKDGNLWLGLDNGIAYVANTSAFTKVDS